MAKTKPSSANKTAEPFIHIDQFILGFAIGAVIGTLLVSIILFVSIEETNASTLNSLQEINESLKITPEATKP